MDTYFSTQSGWLLYSPTSHFRLPYLVRVRDRGITGAQSDGKGNVTYKFLPEEEGDPVTVPLCRKDGSIRYTRPLYRLVWPGEVSDPKKGLRDQVPAQFMERMGLCQCGDGLDTDRDGNCPRCTGECGSSHHSLKDAVSAGLFREGSLKMEQLEDGGFCEVPNQPEAVPVSIAYHMAVNAKHYFPLKTDGYEAPQGRVNYPVGALPSGRVQAILNSRFALDDKALMTLAHLRHRAETERENPLLKGFDTMIRDGLHGLTEKTVQLYFWLLKDYLYDPETHYWVKEDKRYWDKLAGLLFWQDRTGSAVTTSSAGFGTYGVIQEGDPDFERVQQEMPDLLVRMHTWHDELDCARNQSHETGLAPGVLISGEVRRDLHQRALAEALAGNKKTLRMLREQLDLAADTGSKVVIQKFVQYLGDQDYGDPQGPVKDEDETPGAEKEAHDS